MRISDWSSDVCSSDLALRVGLAGHEHGGVADIMLLDPDAVFQFYGPEAPRIRFIPGGIVQQGREYRIAVDAGDAGPYHPPGPVDQRRSLADRKSTRLNSSH